MSDPDFDDLPDDRRLGCSWPLITAVLVLLMVAIVVAKLSGWLPRLPII